jgi:hypothetical protein
MAPWIIGLLAAVGFLFFARPPERPVGRHEPPLLPRKEVLLSAGAAYKNLVADYFWIQLLQATSRAQSPEEYLDLYHYAKVIIELDPEFRAAYAFPGGAIPTKDGSGTWRNVDEAIELLSLGHRRFPDHVQMGILLAYNLSTFRKQHREAGAILKEVAALPDAPDFVAGLATRMFAAADDFDAGIEFARRVYESTEDPEIRKTFEHRLKHLYLEKMLKHIDAAIQAYRESHQRPPGNIRDLVRQGLLEGMPNDPFGGEILIGEDGRAYSTAEKKRLKLFAPEDHS